jgi:hypothetical protein
MFYKIFLCFLVAAFREAAASGNNETWTTPLQLPPPTPLHFVWVSPHLGMEGNGSALTRAATVAHNWSKLLRHHVHARRYKVMFWTDKKVRDTFPHLVSVLSRVPVASWLSDIIRYHVLLEYGGVYLDTDVLPVRDFTPLMDRFDSNWTVCQTPWLEPDPSGGTVEPVSDCESVICAIIAAQPGHPAVRCAAEESLAYTREAIHYGKLRDASFAMWTGPSQWSACVREHSRMAVLPSWTFLPCNFWSRGSCKARDYEEYPHVYGMHEWTSSWGSPLIY